MVATITTTATAATAVSTRTTATATATAAGRTFFARTGDVDRQGAAIEFLAATHQSPLGFFLGLLMVTNAKPRGRPVMRSIMMLIPRPCRRRRTRLGDRFQWF